LRLRLPTTALVAILLLAFAVAADAALVRVGRLVLRADGGFSPRTLPRNSFAPIHFQGNADVSATDSGPIPPLRRLRLDFDRDGRLTTRGLPVCLPEQLEGTTPAAARRACESAIVGTGQIAAALNIPGLSGVSIRSPLTFFNGPRQGGHPTAVAHAQATFPVPETYVIVIPIERLGGAYSYRATLEMPEIAGGFGSLTHIDAKIGRIYRAGGAERSYVSARCRDSVLETRGRVDFEDGTVIEGVVFRGCNVKPTGRAGSR
jgi:hypothetical protein